MAYKKIFLSALCAVLLILAFPKPQLEYCAWFALVPWLFALRAGKAREAFILSYLTGLIFFSGVIYWVNYVSKLGFIILVFYLALYFGIFGLFAAVYSAKLKKRSLFVLPFVWVALEYIRSHLFTGFGWALLGYSQYRVLPVIQISDITGVYGVSFIIVLVNVGVYQLISREQSIESRVRSKKYKIGYKKQLGGLGITALAIALVLAYGYAKLHTSVSGESIKLAVVQGNVPQKIKWDQDFREDILKKYIRLTEQVGAEGPQLIIWPETSVPGYLENDPLLLKEVAALSQRTQPAYLLLGAPHEGEKGKFYNRASLMLRGKIIDSYDKVHLVPFGEFIPFWKLFSRFSFANLIGNFSPGEEYTVFSLSCANPPLKLSVLICFEDVFAPLVRRFVRDGARVLANITNDAWFFDSAEPYQHLQASVLRAVENRVNVVRSANTGVSCFIDPWGRILSRVSNQSGQDLMVEAAKTQQLQLIDWFSVYTAYGDIFAWFCLLASLLVTGNLLKFKAKKA